MSKVYCFTPHSFSVIVKRDGMVRSINDYIEECKENFNTPDLDPTEEPGKYALAIKINADSPNHDLTLEDFANLIKDEEWGKKWRSDHYFNHLSAYNKDDDGSDADFSLNLMVNEAESSETKKVLYWYVNLLKGTEKELNELVYRMNQAQVLGPIEVLLK